MELLTVFVIWGLMCWGVAALAGTRGRSSFGFFLLSFVFSPLLGLIVVLVMKNLTEEAGKESERRREDERRELDRKREHETQLESLRAVAASQSSRAPAQALETAVTGSIADELTKLAALRDKGILSPSEFAMQKARLLGPSSEARRAAPNESSGSIRIPTTADLSTFDSCTPKELTIETSTPDNCRATLVALGCRVSQPRENEWEVLEPSGITAYARSPEALEVLTIRFARKQQSQPSTENALIRLAKKD